MTDYCRHVALPANMACLNTLKQEIKTLEKIFPKNHERFQILNSSVDELLCRFIDKNGKRYDIHANITVSAQINTHTLRDTYSSFIVVSLSQETPTYSHSNTFIHIYSTR